MRKIIEDIFINKLYGYYLAVYGKDHLLLAEMIYLFGETVVYFMVLTHLINPRIHSFKK